MPSQMANVALICVAFCFVFAQGFLLSPKSPLNCLWSGTAVSSKCHSQMFSSVRPELNPGQITSRDVISYVSGAFGVALATAVFIKPTPAMASDVIESTYRDYSNGFSLLVEPGWSIMPRKTPTPTMLQFQSEEVLFTGSRFNEDGGASSLSVTRSNAARLLKDFEIEWWFAPLKKMADLCSAELVAGLLILQRQGEVCGDNCMATEHLRCLLIKVWDDLSLIYYYLPSSTEHSSKSANRRVRLTMRKSSMISLLLTLPHPWDLFTCEELT